MKKILIILLSLYSFSFAFTCNISGGSVPERINTCTVNNETFCLYSDSLSYVGSGSVNDHYSFFGGSGKDDFQTGTNVAGLKDGNPFWWINSAHLIDCTTLKAICPSGQVWDENSSSCITPAPPCPSGQIKNSSGTCCDVGNADTLYNVDQATCSTQNTIKIDDLTFLTNINWNSCLGECTATSGTCPKDKVFDSNGYCVPPTLDPTQCEAQGGTLQNFSYDGPALEISNGPMNGQYVCTYNADCVVNGSPVSTVSTYVSCGADSNATDNNNTTDLNVTTGDNGNNNKCSTCPTQYPIANDQGSCENSVGDILMCPSVDYNNTNNITCGTCSSLGAGWSAADNGDCKHTTVNNIVQYAACPTSPSTDTNMDINTTPDQNSTFTDPNLNSSNTPDKKCTSCPAGYKSIGGLCGLTNANGVVVSYISCPGGAVDQSGTGTGDQNGTSDQNGTGDQNGTDDTSKMMKEFGDSIKGSLNKAYKKYSFFNSSDCGSLQVSAPVYLFNQPNAKIEDPLPMFVDILTPYRDIIKGFLMFIAVVIGLFDFFRRS